MNDTPLPTSNPIQSNVTEISHDGVSYIIIGTAHVSKSSVALVTESIAKYQPDVVCVELCDKRAQAIRNPDRWRETDIFKIIKEKKAYVLFAQLLLASLQKKIAARLDIQPGAEMRAACDLSDQRGIPVINVDRDIRTTLRRAWSRLGYWSLFRLCLSGVTSGSSVSEISEEEIERLKSSDLLAVMISDFSEYLPGIKEVLIDERDSYLAAKIAAVKGRCVLAVVGAGHVPGICKKFGTAIDLAELEQEPPRTLLSRVLPWLVPVGLISIFAYLFWNVGSDASGELLSTWVISHSLLSGLGALIAFAHPLTILTAIIVTPITSIIRAVPGGWLCALTEALLRKPRVKDLENLLEDASTISGFWHNRVSRILLIIILVNLGSFGGTIWGYLKAISLL